MKISTIILVLASMVYPKEITGEYQYQIGENETTLSAKEKGRDLALRHAVESFAIYFESNTVIQNYCLTKDQIKSTVLGLVTNCKTDYNVGNNQLLYVHVSAVIDSEKVMESLQNLIKLKEEEHRIEQQRLSTIRIQEEQRLSEIRIEEEQRLSDIRYEQQSAPVVTVPPPPVITVPLAAPSGYKYRPAAVTWLCIGITFSGLLTASYLHAIR